MKKLPLWCAISYSIISIWWTFRFFTNLPQIAEQSNWITVMDVLWLICGYALAISYWVMFVKGAKKGDEKDVKKSNGRE